MRKFNIAIVSIVILFFIYLFVKDRYDKPDQLKQNAVILNAWTVGWVIGSKGSYDLKYFFDYKGEQVIGYAAFRELRGNMNFVHKYFPLIFNSNSGEKELLVEPRRFQAYKIAFPDSLKWVLQFIEE